MREIQLLLDGAPSVPDFAFEDALRELQSTLRRMPGLGRVELALRMSADALAALPHFAASEAAGLAPRAILSIDGAEPAFLDALQKTTEALHGCVDAARCRFLTGTRHEILPGTDALRLFFGLPRLPHLTREQFQSYWLDHHAPIGRRLIPPHTYHQFHASTDAQWTARVARTCGFADAGFDGIVDCHFPDVDAFVAQLSRPEVTGEALEDERRFIDHSRAVFWLYRMV